MKKHYLNVDYAAKYNRHISRPGREKQITVKLGGGRGPLPQLQWDASVRAGDDQPFIESPIEYEKIGDDDEGKTQHWVAKLPSVGGAKVAVRLKVGDRGFKKVAEFETWRRVALRADCYDERCYKLLKGAFPKIKAAFEAAFIEVVLASVDVDGERKVDRDVNTRTDIYLTFKEASWDYYTQKFELDVSRDGVAGHRLFRKEGDLLILSLDDDAFRVHVSKYGIGYFEEATFQGEGRVVHVPEEATFGEAARAAKTRVCHCKVGNKTLDPNEDPEDEFHKTNTVVVDLGAPQFAEFKQKVDAGTTMRLTLHLGLECFGRSAGGNAIGSTAITVSPGEDWDAQQTASVINHEIGHAFGLVKAEEKMANGSRIKNFRYHSNEYGGNGPHCSYNAKLVPNGGTESGQIFEHDSAAGPLCVMHFKTSPEVDDAKFCPSCTAQLRRAVV